jgi:uncharacterized membrane protein YfcA
VEYTNYIFAGLAAVFAGFINAIAGGGTLITFPTLTAIGIPPIAANITNTIALCPGYFGGIYAQRNNFNDQKGNLLKLLPVSILGGITGGVLLIKMPESSFRTLIPYLILIATALLAFQIPLKKWANSRANKSESGLLKNISSLFFVFLAAVYGGYFGAGLGVILMAVLGLVINESLQKLNVLKQTLSFLINTTAAIFFCFSGKAEWIFILIMAIGAIGGGFVGGKLVDKIPSNILRYLVVAIGLVVATIYFIK